MRLTRVYMTKGMKRKFYKTFPRWSTVEPNTDTIRYDENGKEFSGYIAISYPPYFTKSKAQWYYIESYDFTKEEFQFFADHNITIKEVT